MYKHKISHTSKLLLATAVFSVSVIGHTEAINTNDTVQGFNYSEKAIRVSAPQARNNTSSRPELVTLSVTPHKSSYRVNEPMSFSVRGDKDYYLYVFNVDPVSNKMVMLIPNANTKDHHLQANKTYNIPGTVNFFADRPGKENIVFIGATRPLPLRQQGFQAMGEFSMASANDVQQSVYEFDSKAIMIGDKTSGGNNGVGNRNNANKAKLIELQIY